MMTRLHLLLLWTCLWFPGLATADESASGSAVGGAKPPAADLEHLIHQLDDPKFSQRTQAVRQLTDIGLPALPHVIQASMFESAEAQMRAFSILMTWSRGSDDELQSATVSALQNLAASGTPRTARLAEQALELRREDQLQDAIMFFESLGGRVAIKRSTTGDVDYSTLQITAAWQGNDDDLNRLQDLEQLQWLSIENSTIGNRGMRAIAACTELRQLYLGQTRITEPGLRELRGLDNLRYVSLRFLNVGNSALTAIGPLPQLESLGLDGTQVSDEGLVHLGEFPQLKSLWLDGTRITDAGLMHLQQLPNLNRLFLSKTSTGGAGLKHLAALNQLDYLSLKEVQMTPEGMAALSSLQTLTTLGLDHTNVDDDMLVHLSGLDNLQVLWLSRTPVTDACFEHLKGLPKLRTIMMHGSNATKEGAEAFQKAHGQCRVQL